MHQNNGDIWTSFSIVVAFNGYSFAQSDEKMDFEGHIFDEIAYIVNRYGHQLPLESIHLHDVRVYFRSSSTDRNANENDIFGRRKMINVHRNEHMLKLFSSDFSTQFRKRAIFTRTTYVHVYT